MDKSIIAKPSTDSLLLLYYLRKLKELELSVIDTKIEVFVRGYAKTSGYNWKDNKTDSDVLKILVNEFNELIKTARELISEPIK